MIRRQPSLWILGALSALMASPLACKGGSSDGAMGGVPGSASGGRSSTGGRAATGGEAGSTGGEAGSASGGEGGMANSDECLKASGPGTEVPSAISEDQTWTHEGSPYIVPNNVLLTANLVLEKCTVVRLAKDVTVTVRGSLTARGTATELDSGEVKTDAVLFAPIEEDQHWGSIDVESEGQIDLEVAALVNGGAREATIHAWGEDQYGLPHRNVRSVGTYIAGSAGPAFFLETRAAFTEDSTDLAIESSGSEEVPYPIVLEAGTVATLPSGLSLDGNLNDEVYVNPFRQVEEDTFKDIGYSYVIGGRLVVAQPNGVTASGVSTLTIEPGVTLRMLTSAMSGLVVGNGDGYPGRLIANGTASKPIRFESGLAEASAGDWLGLYFSAPVSSGNSLKYVEIAHAGAPSGAQGYGCGPIENDASILILNATPVEPFIENCSIESAGGDTQILLGWDYDGDAEASASALFGANTFDENGPACHVSLPQNADSQCPGLDSEPDCL